MKLYEIHDIMKRFPKEHCYAILSMAPRGKRVTPSATIVIPKSFGLTSSTGSTGSVSYNAATNPNTNTLIINRVQGMTYEQYEQALIAEIKRLSKMLSSLDKKNWIESVMIGDGQVQLFLEAAKRIFPGALRVITSIPKDMNAQQMWRHHVHLIVLAKRPQSQTEEPLEMSDETR